MQSHSTVAGTAKDKSVSFHSATVNKYVATDCVWSIFNDMNE